MNQIYTVTFALGLSVTVLGKAVLDEPVADAAENPRYAFNYAISDPRTKDNKAQWEHKDGDLVNGAYSLLEPDGSLRVVEYTADDISGFSAIVKTLAAKLATPVSIPNLYPIQPTKPLTYPHNYGFGARPLKTGDSKVKVTGTSYPWDPKTGSYGGWVPINGNMRKVIYATIISKKYINGQIQKVAYGPIPIHGKSIILIKKKNIDD